VTKRSKANKYARKCRSKGKPLNPRELGLLMQHNYRRRANFRYNP